MVIGAVRALERLTSTYEVIVVDDGSCDATAEVLGELEQLYPGRVRVEQHARNRGYGAALRTGIASATKEWVFYTDGDAQYDVREIALLVAMAGDDVDVVNGYKISRSDPLYRKLIGGLYNAFVHVAFRLHIRDVDCDFRLMRRSRLEKLMLKSDSGTICVEMIKKLEDAGCRFAEVPVHHFHRSVGRSQFFRPYWLLKTFLDLIELWREMMFAGPEEIPASGAAPAAIETHHRTRLP